MYVCYTYRGESATTNRIAVLTETNGQGGRLTVLLGGIPAGSYHDGCRLKFGPDGKLYATTGDATYPELAQSPKSLAGKILRLSSDGSVPDDNPFPGSYVWSLGHRNPQGLAWQPGSGLLFATEHGTGDGGNNELNIIEPGKNYGWPTVIGNAGDPRFVDPVLVNGDAPAGAAFVTGDRYPELRGSLLIATLSSQRLLQVVFRPGRPKEVLRTEPLIENSFGRLRDVIQGPDGSIYVATSNRDGRGQPSPEDDRILRLVH